MKEGSRGRGNLGYLIDNIWNDPEAKHLLTDNPMESPQRHEALLQMGKGIIDYCWKSGAKLNPRMDDTDHDIWLRVVAAWVCYLKEEKEPRCAVANKIGIDASNLTNFINGKRAITANALTMFADLFGIQAFDLRPDLGASYVDDLRHTKIEGFKKIKRENNWIRNELDRIQSDQDIVLENLESIQSNSPHIAGKISSTMLMIKDISARNKGIKESINKISETLN